MNIPAMPTAEDLNLAMTRIRDPEWRKLFAHGAEFTGEFRKVRASVGEDWYFNAQEGRIFYSFLGTTDNQRIVRPKTAPQLPPKPSEAWLEKHGYTLTDICESPVHDGMTSYFCEEHYVPQQYTTELVTELRWRVTKKLPTYVPWTEDTVPVPLVLRRNEDQAIWITVAILRDGVLMCGANQRYIEFDTFTPAVISKKSWKTLQEKYTQRDGSPCGTLQK